MATDPGPYGAQTLATQHKTLSYFGETMTFTRISFGFILLFSASYQANASNISDKVKIETVKSFTTTEVWNSAKPIYHRVRNVSMTYSLIDPETPIMAGQWRQCANVMIGNGDLGSIPVAFRIWTKGECNVEIKNSDGAASLETIDLQLMVNVDLPINVSVSERLDVTVNGSMRGRIRSIYN